MLGSVALLVLQNAAISGELPGATHIGTKGEPGEGAYVRIWLIVKEGKIEMATYATHGCPSSQAASGMTAVLATGRTLEEARRITADDVRLVLGGLPDGKGHFADMSVSALAKAMEHKG